MILSPPCLSFPGRKPTPRVPLDASSDRAVSAAQFVRSAGAEARCVTRGLARRPLGQVGRLKAQRGTCPRSRRSQQSLMEPSPLKRKKSCSWSAGIKTRALVAPYSYGYS